MILKKEQLNLLIIFIFIILEANVCFSLGKGEAIPGTQVYNPNSIAEITPDSKDIINLGDGDNSIPSVGKDVSINTGSGLLKNLEGSYKLLTYYNQIVGGVIVSSKDNNVIPTLNLLDGSLVFYNLQQGDKVEINQIGSNGIMGDEYKAVMSEGVSAEIQANNKVRFTAYGDDSLLKIKPSEEPSYEFNNGLLEYENKNVLEQINTTKINEASVDKSYEYGFKCLTLASDADYNYNDKIKPERSFEVKNLNRQDYQLCVKKTVYDDYSMTGQRYGIIDLVKDSVALKAKVIYSKKNIDVYEGLDDRNEAVLETSLGTTKISITNPAPSSDTISQTFISSHVLSEVIKTGKIIRFHSFMEKKGSDVINIYSTLFKSSQPDISINNDLLVQKGKNKFSAWTYDNIECFSMLKSLFAYEEEDSFYDNC